MLFEGKNNISGAVRKTLSERAVCGHPAQVAHGL